MNRWIAGILLFDFTLVHIPAERHTGADGLSQQPKAPEDPEDPGDHEDWIDSANGFTVSVSDPYVPYHHLLTALLSPPLLTFSSLPLLRPNTLFPHPDSYYLSNALSFTSTIPSTPSSSLPDQPTKPPTIPRSEKAISMDQHLN